MKNPIFVPGLLSLFFLSLLSTAQAASQDASRNLPFIEWLEGNWGEATEDGEPFLGGCKAMQSLSPDYEGKLLQRQKKQRQKFSGILSFSALQATKVGSLYVSSGYPDIEDGSLVQTWYNGKATTEKLGVSIASGGMFMTYHFGGLIPGLPNMRKLIPLDDRRFKLVVTDGASGYAARDRFYVRCE